MSMRRGSVMNPNIEDPLLSPPLPLMRFKIPQTAKQDVVKTVNSELIHSIDNIVPLFNSDTKQYENGPLDPLGDPLYSKKLSKYFTARAQKELIYRQNEYLGIPNNPPVTQNNATAAIDNNGDNNSTVPIDLFEYIVYESNLHSETARERNERNNARTPEEEHHKRRYEHLAHTSPSHAANSTQKESSASHPSSRSVANDDLSLPPLTTIDTSRTQHSNTTNTTTATTHIPPYTKSLKFSGDFESGNIERVTRIFGRETILTSPNNNNSSSNNRPQEYDPVSFVTPSVVDQEYDIVLRKDINTEGNIQWYYFNVACERDVFSTAQSSGGGNSHNNMAGGGTGFDRTDTVQSSSASVNSNSTSNKPSNSNPLNVPTTYPLKVRFNIVNFQKSDSLYNYGMKPAVLSTYEQTHPCSLRGSGKNSHRSPNSHKNNKNASSPPCNTTSPKSHTTHTMPANMECGWKHSGCDDICYYRNGNTLVKSTNSASNQTTDNNPTTNSNIPKKAKNLLSHQYTLTFTYTFTRSDSVYFAHTFPYTYSDLQRYLHGLENDNRVAAIMHKKVLCKTLCGNNCDLLSITERCSGVIESRMKPSIVLSARVHPGEANSSYIMHGLLEYLLGESDEAVKLRRSFVFHVVPMLNPDGVIHGNYRCSLAGTDLNRRYVDTHFALHPTIHALKNFIRTTQVTRLILLYLDIHGHSKMKNCFLYGCDVTQQSERITRQLLPLLSEEDIASRRIYARLFPKILCAVSQHLNAAAATNTSPSSNTRPTTSGTRSGGGGGGGAKTQPFPFKNNVHHSAVDDGDEVSGRCSGNFNYADCSFKIDRGKSGTGRVVAYRDLSICAAYTIEASFCGNGDNAESKILRRLGQQQSQKPVSVYAQQQQTSSSGAQNGGFSGGGGSGKESKRDRDNRERIQQNSEGNMKISKSEPTLSGQHNQGSGAQNHSTNCEEDSDDNTTVRNTKMNTLVSNAKSAHSEALSDLLVSYQHAIHYNKQHLMSIGLEIGTAIFHFTNLSHSNLEQEVGFATTDFEQNTQTFAHNNHLNLTPKANPVTPVNAVVNNTTSSVLHKQASFTAVAGVVSGASAKNKSGKMQRNVLSQVALSGGGMVELNINTSVTDNSEPNSSSGKYFATHIRSPDSRRRLDTALRHSAQNSEGNSEGGSDVEQSHASQTQPQQPPLQKKLSRSNVNSGSRGIADDDQQHNKINTNNINKSNSQDSNNTAADYDLLLRDRSASLVSNTSLTMDANDANSNNPNTESTNNSITNTTMPKNDLKLPPNITIPAAATAGPVCEEFRGTKISLHPETYLYRSALKSAIFSDEALYAILKRHTKDFAQQQQSLSTFHIPLRTRTEYEVRKMLHFLPVPKEGEEGSAELRALLGGDADASAVDLEGSLEGSESDPSGDNVPTARMIKNMGRFKDSSALMAAMRKEAAKKRKKDSEEKRKSDKKRLKAMAKLERESQQALEEAAALAAQQQEAYLLAVRQAAMEAAQEEMRLKAAQRRPSSAGGTGRKGSIFQSSPKHTAPYRYAPEERLATAPVQIKLVNFKDFDGQNSYGSGNNAQVDLNKIFSGSGLTLNSGLGVGSMHTTHTGGGNGYVPQQAPQSRPATQQAPPPISVATYRERVNSNVSTTIVNLGGPGCFVGENGEPLTSTAQQPQQIPSTLGLLKRQSSTSGLNGTFGTLNRAGSALALLSINNNNTNNMGGGVIPPASNAPHKRDAHSSVRSSTTGLSAERTEKEVASNSHSLLRGALNGSNNNLNVSANIAQPVGAQGSGSLRTPTNTNSNMSALAHVQQQQQLKASHSSFSAPLATTSGSDSGTAQSTFTRQTSKPLLPTLDDYLDSLNTGAAGPTATTQQAVQQTTTMAVPTVSLNRAKIVVNRPRSASATGRSRR
eukprot:gene24116-30424_t